MNEQEEIPMIVRPALYVQDEDYDPYYDPNMDQFHVGESDNNTDDD